VVEVRTVVDRRPAKLGTFHLTRAHVALMGAKRMRLWLAQLSSKVAQSLSKELGKPVAIQFRLMPTMAHGREALADPAAFAIFELGAVGALALLEVETAVAGAFVDALAGGPAAMSVPYAMTAAERAVLGFLCLLAVQAVREDGSAEKMLAPRFVRALESSGEAASLLPALGSYLVIELKLKIGEASGMGRLLVPSAAIVAISASQPPEVRRSFGFRACVSALVLVPPIAFERTEVESLTPGDVVLVPGAKLAASAYHGVASLCSAGFRIEGAFGPKGFTVEKAQTTASPEEIMTPNNSPKASAKPAPTAPPPPPNGAAKPVANVAPGLAPAPAPAKPLPPLPVELCIELARIKIALADLANVEPGAVLPLHVGPCDAVVLRIGEELIARGELVDIEGELGVRILSLGC
jgi:type III secretion protein Q